MASGTGRHRRSETAMDTVAAFAPPIVSKKAAATMKVRLSMKPRLEEIGYQQFAIAQLRARS